MCTWTHNNGLKHSTTDDRTLNTSTQASTLTQPRRIKKTHNLYKKSATCVLLRINRGVCGKREVLTSPDAFGGGGGGIRRTPHTRYDRHTVLMPTPHFTLAVCVCVCVCLEIVEWGTSKMFVWGGCLVCVQIHWPPPRPLWSWRDEEAQGRMRRLMVAQIARTRTVVYTIGMLESTNWVVYMSGPRQE